MDSYMNTLPKSLNAEHLETIRALFMWLVQPCLCKYFLHIAIHFCVGLTEEFANRNTLVDDITHSYYLSAR